MTGPGSGRSCGALPLVAALLLAACGGVQAGRAEPDTRPEAAREPRGETRRACEARCRRVVETRHDACGLGAGRPWPDWCAEDNARWQTECELDCRAKSAR